MADLNITAANVLKGSGASTASGVAGEALTAGLAIYVDAADGNKIKIADNDAGAAKAAVAGITLHACAAGQPIQYQTSGLITIGATVAVGQVYVLSSNAGGICPEGDAGASDYLTVIGVGVSATQIMLRLFSSGIQHA